MRKAVDAPVIQSSFDAKHYSFDWTANGAPDSASCVVYDMSVKPWQTCPNSLDGVTIINDNVITTPKVYNLTAGKVYRLISIVTIAGNTLSSYADISCEL